MCESNKYKTYTLELIRNNGIPEENSNRTEFCYLMFDYFDILYCKELRGKDKKYLDYLSIENVFENVSQEEPPKTSYSVSYKSLSLYRKSDNQPDLFCNDVTSGHLSQTPFLALIQISLCKENYIHYIEEKQGRNENEIDVDDFLTRCESEIMALVSSSTDGSAKTRKQIFRSSTTGDFCLVIRSDSVSDIYNIAIKLNGTQNITKEDKAIKLLTYTNVGIECIRLPDGGYTALDNALVTSCKDLTIALRFTGDLALYSALQGYIAAAGSGSIEPIQGLFGRYEYLMHINMNEFADLYPFLCEKKVGVNGSPSSKTGLAKIFDNSGVKNINERILVEIQNIGEKTGQGSFDKDNELSEKQKITNKNDILLEKIRNLSDWRNYFQEEHCAFQDLFRGMQEIYKAFSSTGMEREVYTNWLTFHEDMSILCECINGMMKYYQDWEKKIKNPAARKQYRINVLKNWRIHLQAVNQYTKLVQSVNYQTYQSPIYEIQTQIDTEKVMVAYREAMELYVSNGVNIQSAEAVKEIIHPVIYPDISKDKVEITAPFMTSSLVLGNNSREIICTVPSFEYFGRLYDLLPWIIHESSHHLRILGRSERNHFVAEYTFSYIFGKAMEEPLRELSNHDSYKEPGRLEKYLLECMSRTALEALKAQEDFQNYNFQKLVFEIDNWLNGIFSFGIKYRGQIHCKSEKELKNQLFDFYLDAYRKESMLNDETLDKILGIREAGADESMEELTEDLLARYFQNLVKEEPGIATECQITLEDVFRPRNYLEDKLENDIGKRNEYRTSAAVREYCYQVLEISRIVNMSSESTRDDRLDEALKEYLEDVFRCFQDTYKSKIEYDNLLVDAVSRHIARNLGLLNQNPDHFQTKMREIIHNADNHSIMLHKNNRLRIYKEAFADVLMATSLQLDSFGYCRQVLQTVSDANLSNHVSEYKDVNYERFRIVTAILLAEELNITLSDSDQGVIHIEADSLIKKGKEYCRYTIMYIRSKIFADIEKNVDLKAKVKETEESVTTFLKELGIQIEQYLDTPGESFADTSLLYILLNGDGYASKEVCKAWEGYKETAKFCDPYKYNFWRIDCFCKGIGKILQQGKVHVEAGIFRHMREVRNKAKGSCSHGCLWEKNWKCLVEPRKDVGEFYNNPKQVYEKTPDKKLENTIEFIQNYYYCCQFRIMKQECEKYKEKRK